MLTSEELARYARQLVLPELGVAGQERLRKARVLVVGTGGLGSPAAQYLTAAGVGTVGLVDDDVVDVSNLHRQVLHGTADVGRLKTESAQATLSRLNPNVDLRAHARRLTRENAESIVCEYDLVIDGSDNYPTRYAVNDACAVRGIVWVYGSVERYSGQVSVFGAAEGPCYRCLFPEAPAPGSSPSCEEIGVLGAVPGVIGALQALEALKWLAGIGEPLVGRLLQMDFLTAQTRIVKFDRRPGCVVCGESNGAHVVRNDSDAETPLEIAPQEAQALMAGKSPPLMLDVREPWEVGRARIGNPTAIPMRELEARLDSLDKEREMIVYCHHGSRSRMVSEWLRAMGFRARNLTGGIDRWSRDVDSGVPRY